SVAGDHPAEGLAEALVAEADAQDGHPAAQLADRRQRDAGVVRVARPRRDDQRAVAAQLGDRDGIVAVDLSLRAELGQVLDQVVGEGVVVVDDGDPHGISSARRIASKSTPALASVSWYSRSGTESATIPAPA